VAALVYGATPVFADIDPETFCLDPQSVAARLTSRTRAVIGVDLFGHPAPWDELRRVVAGRPIVLIEDAAQAPGARQGERFAGTLGDIGVFSLNYHKTIHSGEGGVVVTNDTGLAERLQLIRNHGEAVVAARGGDIPSELIGFNYRMTEIEAAIALEQLKKLERLLRPRIEAADHLSAGIRKIPGLTPPVVRPGVRHGYYVYPVRYDATVVGASRDRFVAALRAEGIPAAAGYVAPLYRQPIYRRHPDRYPDGLCPVAERMHERELFYFTFGHAQVTRADLDDVIAALEKVAAGIGALAPA
jgi:dTDP-4-amino-4,6-dideoxygalactose transaminase